MRELEITDQMKVDIRRVNGGVDIDYGKIAVFESRSLNTRPLRRRSGLFAGAVMKPNVLEEMAAKLNSSDEGIPLHRMHETSLLNVGRLFAARVDVANDGASEISSLFYINRENADLIATINSGVTDQVSIGILGKKLLCSACGFDYKNEGDMVNMMDATCDNGHSIGHDGVHLIVDGLDDWMEQSVVDTGASGGARVVGKSQSRFSPQQTDFYQMAARSHQNDRETYIPLIANLSDILSEENQSVTEEKLNELLDAKFAKLDEAVAAKQAELDAANTTIVELNAKVAELEAAQAADTSAAKVTELEGEKAELKAEVDAAKTYLAVQAKKAQVASGVATPTEPETIEAAIALIDASAVNLVNLFARDKLDAKTPPSDIKLGNGAVTDFRAFKAHR